MNSTEMAREIRRIVLEQSHRAHVGHIGSCLSVADILAALYAPEGGLLNISSPAAIARDRFVLSKGHAALALYAALHLRGWISQKEMDTFCEVGSPIYTHPNHEVRGVDFSTGSLGMGLSFGAGAAFAGKLQGSAGKTYVLCSDAEMQEGSTWEAVMFAAQNKLSNLVLFVDYNEQQALGSTYEICRMTNLADRFRVFGWSCLEICEGEDLGAVVRTKRSWMGQPLALVVHTTFGSGVSFMENQLKWHYSPMNDMEYASAMEEVTPPPSFLGPLPEAERGGVRI